VYVIPNEPSASTNPANQASLLKDCVCNGYLFIFKFLFLFNISITSLNFINFGVLKKEFIKDTILINPSIVWNVKTHAFSFSFILIHP